MAGRHKVKGEKVQQSVFGSLCMSATTVVPLLGNPLYVGVCARGRPRKKTGGQLILPFTTAQASKQGRPATECSHQAITTGRHCKKTPFNTLLQQGRRQRCATSTCSDLRPQNLPRRCATRHVPYTLSTLNGKSSQRRITRDINHRTVPRAQKEHSTRGWTRTTLYLINRSSAQSHEFNDG